MTRLIQSYLPLRIIVKCGFALLMIFLPCPAAALDGCLNLFWTAPGDDGSAGRAAIYEIRYFTEPITEENWESAWKAPQPPSPKRAGSTEKYTLKGIESDLTYFVAIKAADELLNWSPISNIVQYQSLTDTCIGIVGNVNCDPGQNVDISDITALTAYLFNTSLAPCICLKEADIYNTGDNQVDISDLMQLLRYLFLGTGYLASCP